MAVRDRNLDTLLAAGMSSTVCKILADPTGRRLVEALRDAERSVGELVEVVGIGQPGVSRQLAILQDAHSVVVCPEGRRRLYALRPEPFRALDERRPARSAQCCRVSP